MKMSKSLNENVEINWLQTVQNLPKILPRDDIENMKIF